ncbi:MAG: M48 family metalloprotease [Vulcanimicrobiaceae bacterium]
MFVRRLLHATLIIAVVCANVPAPARAESTGAEILQAQAEDKQVTDQYLVVTDPLLNQWVGTVGNNLWGQVARRDLPYNAKILDANDINSFTIGGGYIYVNEGLLDFVHSDDELASVIGHETGHNERRHTVTLPAKAQALDLLFGIASIFSPFIYRFGQIAEAGIIAKAERSDELQADQYGLMLMSRAGYDPDAMVAFMNGLGVEEQEHPSLLDKYLADHPGFPDRVSHLLGYPELDPTKRTTDQILVQAIHDQDEGRYGVAAWKFGQVLRTEPQNSSALLGLGQTQLALGQTSKSRQTLGQAAQEGTPATRQVALATMQSLAAQENTFLPLVRPDLSPLRAQLQTVQAQEAAAATALQTRRTAGQDQSKAIDGRIQDISYGVPDFGNIPVRNGTKLYAVLRDFSTMARSISATYEKAHTVIDEIGTTEPGKSSGLLAENDTILRQLAAPLSLDPVPAQSLALLPMYPRMLDDIALTNGDMIRSIDAARASLAVLDTSLGDFNDFVTRLSRSQLDFRGDLEQSDYNDLLPMMQKSNDELNRALVTAAQAEQLYNLARSRQMVTRLTMLGVAYPADRYAMFRHALKERVFGRNDGISYEAMLRDNLSPGEVAAASIIAADTNTTPDAVIAQAQSSRRRLVDVANDRGMDAESLEIFLGLLYADYTDGAEVGKPASVPSEKSRVQAHV